MLHKYGKGTMMTFPLEFTEVTEEQKEWDDQYLMPMEAKKIQLEVWKCVIRWNMMEVQCLTAILIA